MNQVEPTIRLQQLDPEAFGSLVEGYRRELHVHCYRMLGSVQEAVEMVQETYLRAWTRRETYAGRSTLRAWLYKIATNRCIDELRRKPRRVLPVTHEPVSTLEQPIPASIHEPIWLEPYPTDYPIPEEISPEAKVTWEESIRLAFLASLHLLTPNQRAVLILRDVLNWPANEVADLLDQTVSSVKSALHRARATLAEQAPRLRSETMTLKPSDPEISRLLDRYMQAWENADVDGLTALLRDDCTFSMPPIPSWYRGRAVIADLTSRTVFSGQGHGRWRLSPTVANAQPAFRLYRRSDSSGEYAGYGIQVLTLSGSQISDITTFRNPDLLAFFK